MGKTMAKDAPQGHAMSPTDVLFFDAVLALLNLYDLVDVDRDLVREEMELVEARWADVVGNDLATLDDPRRIEETLAEALGTD
jgi:hypothetical protein